VEPEIIGDHRMIPIVFCDICPWEDEDG